MQHIKNIFILVLILSACKPKILIHSSENKAVKNIITDSSLIKSTSNYREELTQTMATIICTSDTFWQKKVPEGNLNNWCADAVLWQANNTENNYKIEACLLNYGGLRASLPQGNLNLRNFFELMPFENKISLLKLKGTQLLLYQKYLISDGAGVMANFNFNATSNKLFINNRSIDSNSSYWIATSDYLANGGDDMSFLTQTEARVDLDVSIRDALINYAKLQKTLYIHSAKRWTYDKP